MSTIILGGGIIGLSTAYYLSTLSPESASENQIHIVDSASDLLLSASGFSGGFLAKDWFSPASASLGELSFRLHKELADANDGPRHWGYAPSITYSLAIGRRGVGSKKVRDEEWLEEGTSRAGVAGPGAEDQLPTGDGAQRQEMLNADGTPAWFAPQKDGTLDIISSPDGCAQIEPKRLCRWLIKKCEERGVKIHTKCTATNIVKGPDGKVSGLKVRKDFEIYDKHCKNIVITAGAWTPQVFSRVFQESKLRIPIGQLAGYSIVVRSPRYTKPIMDPAKDGDGSSAGISHGVFCPQTQNWAFAPEAFSRVGPDGKPEIWVGGLNDPSMKLPPTADGTKDLIDQEKAEELRSAALLMTGLSNEGDNLQVDDMHIVREGLCFRPVSNTGVPVISNIPEKALGHDIEMQEGGGVYLAAGHGPWGISLSLGTGRVMAEMLTGQKLSADISSMRLK